MARYCGPVCRQCRAEGTKLFLKGERCFTNKCAIERRDGVPGQHSRGRRGFSGYGTQLRAKQRLRRMYGLLEAEFRKLFGLAVKTKGVTGTNLMVGLERRLDSLVYTAGFAVSRRQSRQMISHGFIEVDGKRVTIPSYSVAVGQVVSVKEGKKTHALVLSSLQASQSRIVPEWLSLDREEVKVTVNALPTRDQLPQNVNEQLIVELYSKLKV